MVSNLFNSLLGYLTNLLNVVKEFRLVDLLDVAVMAFVIYHAMKLVRETRAMQFLKSIGVIFVVYFIANELNMISLKYLVTMVLDVGVVVLVVLFQPELRKAMEAMGRSKITDINLFGGPTVDQEREAATRELIDVLVDSCKALSAKKTGALMVIERQIKLGEIINSGTVINAAPSQELIGNIFFTNSPLHDGAMILRDCRLYAAGCFLPLSSNMEIGRELGTRHRAALGMSEVSDALVVVVSEETGAISIALDSRLQRNLSLQNLKRLLEIKLLAPEDKDNSGIKNPIARLFRHKEKNGKGNGADHSQDK